MGLFAALSNILVGKPAYGSDKNNPHDSRHEMGKYIPSVRINEVSNRIDGSKLEVYGTVRNESTELIFLDRIFILGIKRELDSELRPGESKQYILYGGPVLDKQPGGRVEIQYRKQKDGDYFANFHSLKSRRDGSNGFVITELRPEGPVKDI